jgi:hypothetical protein
MSSLNRRSTSGGSDSYHRSPDQFLGHVRHPYPSSTDIPVNLPSSTTSGSNAKDVKSHSSESPQFFQGIPSPPYPHCSRDYIPQKDTSQYQHALAAPSWDRQSPLYAPKAQARQASQPLMATPNPSGAASYTSPSSYATRSEYQQGTYYTPHYGSAGIPAPSHLLGAQSYGACSHQVPHRSALTYQALPTIGERFSGYSSTFYPTNNPSAPIVSCQHPTVPLKWPSGTYAAQPYQQSPQPVASRTLSSPSALGGLTSEAWHMIFRCLPYVDRLRLRSVNHFFNDALVALEDHLNSLAHPDPADIADKIGMVAAAENYRRHWAPSLAAKATNRGRPWNDQKALVTAQTGGTKTGRKTGTDTVGIGNLGCYHCYRVLPGKDFCREPSKYDANRVSSDMVAMGGNVAPRRYCLKCGLKKGFHLLHTYYERKVGANIWFCPCGTIHEYGVMSCEMCRIMCPFTPVGRQKREGV